MLLAILIIQKTLSETGQLARQALTSFPLRASNGVVVDFGACRQRKRQKEPEYAVPAMCFVWWQIGKAR